MLPTLWLVLLGSLHRIQTVAAGSNLRPESIRLQLEILKDSNTVHQLKPSWSEVPTSLLSVEV